MLQPWRTCVTSRGDLRWRNRPKRPSAARLLVRSLAGFHTTPSLVPLVPPSLLQPLLPLSLPVDMAVVPQGRRFLPLSQAELGPLFSNSSPFSFSQSLFMVPPHPRSAPASLQASFGPYSATQVRGRKTRDVWTASIRPAELGSFSQLVPEPGLPVSRLLSASLLSEHVEQERDAKGRERFSVRVLFHKWGDSRFGRTCVTLHAFKETEERRASCMTQVGGGAGGGCFPPLPRVHPSIPLVFQPPLGLCVVALSLPRDWFRTPHANQSNQAMERRHGGVHVLRHQHKRHPSYPGNRMQKTTLR